MGYGILQTGASTKNQAMSGIKSAADMEQRRNLQNDQIKRQESQAKGANAAAGASTGAMVGAQAASSMGLGAASIGASALASGGIGLVAGLVLSELF